MVYMPKFWQNFIVKICKNVGRYTGPIDPIGLGIRFFFPRCCQPRCPPAIGDVTELDGILRSWNRNFQLEASG